MENDFKCKYLVAAMHFFQLVSFELGLWDYLMLSFNPCSSGLILDCSEGQYTFIHPVESTSALEAFERMP